ncbi:NAD(P)-dependent oxidoreductase [Nocardia sp. alder85J]|uniref:NAD(P)-dependent oxidoreductase n=1 Tax=Nocardia sp. alder85J TaxID=2862949 RepID=UPI001CD38E1E|nr:NAD(P)-dependent oxidoreductase [Nocardia sp. alder85J]MCX4091441.1 NAD(P)-dependent oxidoreductase [Nocardia sp. alder85J]
MATIAFLGAGSRMGSGMATRLVTAGHRVRVFNRSPEKVAPVVAAGATAADTPRAAAEGAEAVFAMVADDVASRAVWLGDTGALAATAPNAFAVECSTLSRPWVLDLAEHAAAQGFRYVDCPVTGLPDAAAAGRLTLFAGVGEDLLPELRPLLEPLCDNIVRFGGIGAGTTYKLIQNLLGSVQLAATAEALRTAELAGLDLETVVGTLSRGGAASPTVIRASRGMLDGRRDEDIAFTAALRLKDTRIGVELADSVGAPAALGRAAREQLARPVAAGHGDRDETAVFDVLRD